MDVVLFVRHGSFYNLFDTDANVGLHVGLNTSGERTPNMWKVCGLLDPADVVQRLVSAVGWFAEGGREGG